MLKLDKDGQWCYRVTEMNFKHPKDYNLWLVNHFLDNLRKLELRGLDPQWYLKAAKSIMRFEG